MVISHAGRAQSLRLLLNYSTPLYTVVAVPEIASRIFLLYKFPSRRTLLGGQTQASLSHESGKPNHVQHANLVRLRPAFDEKSLPSVRLFPGPKICRLGSLVVPTRPSKLTCPTVVPLVSHFADAESILARACADTVLAAPVRAFSQSNTGQLEQHKQRDATSVSGLVLHGSIAKIPSRIFR